MLIGRKAMGTVAYMGGVPALLEPFVWSWGQMVQWNEESLATETRFIHYDRATISDHAPARNNLAAKFVGDWLIQLDTDHQFEPDIVERLLRTADTFDLDVLTGVYMMKQEPHVPVLYQWVKIGEQDGLQPLASWDERCRVLQIGSAGGGCLFVRRKVFDRIVDELKEQPFDRIHPYSEDHSFFLRLRRLGIPAYADMSIESRHLRFDPVPLSRIDKDQLVQSEPFRVRGMA